MVIRGASALHFSVSVVDFIATSVVAAVRAEVSGHWTTVLEGVLEALQRTQSEGQLNFVADPRTTVLVNVFQALDIAATRCLGARLAPRKSAFVQVFEAL